MSTDQMQRCIQNCQDCHILCVETMGHCLHMGGDHASNHHMALLADCAEICQVAVGFMLRGSERHILTCGVCAKVCISCADDCEQLANGDAKMMECAATCRACATSCMEMSEAA